MGDDGTTHVSIRGRSVLSSPYIDDGTTGVSSAGRCVISSPRRFASGPPLVAPPIRLSAATLRPGELRLGLRGGGP